MISDLFPQDLNRAREERDKALSRVSRENWMQAALAAIASLPAGEGTSEDIRLLVTSRGLRDPHHHNAWGALTRSAIVAGYLVRTGRLAQMKTPKSHARRTEVYSYGPKHG